MKKKTFIIVITVYAFLGCVALRIKNQGRKEQESPFQLAVEAEELLVSSKKGFHSVEIYEREKQLIINAQSEAAFFDGAQFVVETAGEVKEEDIEIIWTALGGKTKLSDDNSFIYAEIRVYEDNKLIFNEKINFVQKAFDIMQELENEEMRPMQ